MSGNATMRAWRIQADHSLALEIMSRPTPAPNEVRVAVHAVGVNRADLLQVAGHYPAPPGYDSSVPGLEYAGRIDAVGARVDGELIGQRVMGLVPGGAYAEAIVTPAGETLPLPDGLDFAAGATIPEAFLTAYRALVLEGGLASGQWCLIRPATAAVGMAAMQLAAALRARPIGASRDVARVTALFPTAGAVSDDASLGDGLLAATAGAGVAVVMDMVGNNWNTVLRGVRTDGRLVLVGVLGGAQVDLDVRRLLLHRQSIHAMTMRSQPAAQRLTIAALYRDRLAPLVGTGILAPLPMRTFPFTAAPAAHADVRQGGFAGKRVLVLDA